MKKTIKRLAFIAMSIGFIALTACGDKDNTPDNNGSENQQNNNNQGNNDTGTNPYFAFHYLGRTLDSAQTVYYYPTQEEVDYDWATPEFFMENLTSEALQVCLMVEKIEGSARFDTISICYGTTCKYKPCPWKSDLFTLTPGVNNEMAIKIDYHPSYVGASAVYRITVGKDTNMSHSQTMYLNMGAQPAGK